ncbi:MAG: hypothetical protein JWN30_969 [Bacilli bacterium]|nr:hypothetical protein [Bacilli bacterium]
MNRWNHQLFTDKVGEGMSVDLQVGDLLFVRGNLKFSSLIKRFTKSDYSHVAVYVGNGAVVEALLLGKVRYTALSKYKSDYDVYRYKRQLTAEQQFSIVHYLHAHIGTSYDYFDLLVLMILFLFNVRLQLKQSSRRMLCSELARNCYRAGRISMPRGHVSPEDLAKCPQLVKVG